MTNQLIFLTAWLASGVTGLGFGLAAVRMARRRLQGLPAADADVITA